MASIPFVSLHETLSRSFATLKIEGMRAVEHEDKEDNNDYSVDPLSDPRLDRFDLFNMVDSRNRDEIFNASRLDAVSLNDDNDPSFQQPDTSSAPAESSTPPAGV